jgi:CDP-diacylglycerol--serine O-phosphatidyltransferase
LYPYGLHDYRAALPALAMVLVPALLMVSTIRFRSFKTIDLKMRRPYTVLFLIALGIMAIATHPKIVLVVIAYSYLASAFIGMAISRFRHHRGAPAQAASDETHQPEVAPRRRRGDQEAKRL